MIRLTFKAVLVLVITYVLPVVDFSTVSAQENPFNAGPSLQVDPTPAPEKKAKKSKSKNKKKKGNDDQKLKALEAEAKRRKAKFLEKLGFQQDYSMELGVNLFYDFTTADVKTADQTATTKLNETEEGGGLQFGWILSDHIEPILEVEYSNVTRKIADFESKEKLLDVGIGLLVNLPQADSYPGIDGLNKFMRAEWVPYFGFLIGQTRTKNKSGEVDKTTYSDTAQHTKLVFGLRYMVYKHISFNSAIRVLYERTESNAEVSGEKGATRSKTKVEVRLISLSLFI